MTSQRVREILLLVTGIVAIVLLTRFTRSHRFAHLEQAQEAPAAEASLVPVPSDPPTAATIAELQARNTGLHWVTVDPRTVMIVTSSGSCGTLTGLAPTQINFHTGRDYDRETHLFSAWSYAYSAAEQYCMTWSRQAAAP